MGFQDAELSRILDALQQMGVRLQGNFNSLSGGEGPAAEEWARRLLREDRYYLMASDMHHPGSLEGRFNGLRWLEEELGPAKTSQILEERPQALLSRPAACMEPSVRPQQGFAQKRGQTS